MLGRWYGLYAAGCGFESAPRRAVSYTHLDVYKSQVASDASMRNVAFIAEHADAFPGITVQTRTVRDYPHGALAAHAVGYTGSVTSDDIASVAEGRDLELGDSVGRSGIEQMYDNLLAGDHGAVSYTHLFARSSGQRAF